MKMKMNMNIKPNMYIMFTIPFFWIVMRIHGFISIPPLSSPIIVLQQFVTKVHDQIDNIKQIPIEHKLNFMYMSYSGRQFFTTFGLSQQTIIHILEELEWTELDYFNTFIIIGALYTLLKNMEVKKTIDKMAEKGIIKNKYIRKRQIMMYILFTVLFRDIENAI